MPTDRLLSWRDFHLGFHNYFHPALHSTIKENDPSDISVDCFDSIVENVEMFNCQELFDWYKMWLANNGLEK